MEYQPFPVGKRLRIVPPGAPAGEEGRIDLVMARGAFGSGEHETTASCLELLEGLPDLPGAAVLDLGAGTGILAVAALLLGAERALLVDNHPAAVESARRHLAANGLAARACVREGEIGDVTESDFQVLLANLHGDVLLAVGPELVRRARPGAALVLSGILWEHNWDVRRLYRGLGCQVRQNLFLDEYSTLLLRREEIQAAAR